MMFLDDQDLTAVSNGIATSERHIAAQEKILAELQRLGEPTHLAEKFLIRLRDTLEMRRHYRDKLASTKVEPIEPGL